MRLLALLLALIVLPGCSLLLPGGDGGVACTLEFRTYTVQVVDAEGRPVDGLTATVRNLRTGEVLDHRDADDIFPQQDGRYLVVTDAEIGRLSRRGDRLLFRATGGEVVAEAEFVFRGGPCHVEKVSGPDRVVAQPK